MKTHHIVSFIQMERFVRALKGELFFADKSDLNTNPISQTSNDLPPEYHWV